MTTWSWLRAVARPTAVVLGLGIAVAGCQVVPGSGPTMSQAQSTSTDVLPFDVIDLTPTTVAAYRPTPPVDHGASSGSFSAGGRIAVAPGDLLRVRVFERYEGGIFPTIQRPGADLGVQRVTADGTIEVLYAGIVNVAGLDLTQIEQRIAQKLAGKAQEPQVMVELVADRTNTVMVSGEVKNPGSFSLLDGTRSVVGAISRAGGLATQPGTDPSKVRGLASQVEVVLRRNGRVILTSRFSDLLAGGDVPIQKGDEIVLRPDARSYVLMGAVGKSAVRPGAGPAAAGGGAGAAGAAPQDPSNLIELTKPNTTLADALGEARGLNDQRSDITGVFVFRMGDIQTNPTARARVFRLDLLQPVSLFVAGQFAIQPRDVVYVSNAPLYEFNKVLTPIYGTFSIVGVTKGTTIPATTF